MRRTLARMPSFDLVTDFEKLEEFIVDGVAAATHKGMYSAAVRGLQLIQVGIIPKEIPQPVDRGIYRSGWAVDGNPSAPGSPISVYNPVPYAAIIEWGARAENIKPGKKMIDALTEWVKRKGIAKDTDKKAPKAAKGERIPKAKVNGFVKQFNKLLARLAQFIKRMRIGAEVKIKADGSKELGTVSDAKARSMAWAIAKKMQQVGIFNRNGGHGLRIGEKGAAAMVGFVEVEVAREITRAFG